MGSGQTKYSELIRHGAAGASGTVREPFAIQAKFPHPNMHVHYARGCTLAEAYYQSVACPFQLLIVGDALCQPYAKQPRFRMRNEFDAKEVHQGELVFEMLSEDTSPKIHHYEFYIDGRLHSQAENDSWSFNSQSISDGYHEFRIVAVASNVARNRYRQIIPISINNQGASIDARTTRQKYNWREKFNVEVSSSQRGSVVEIVHNGRSLGKSKLSKGKAIVRVDANAVGRGPVRLFARTKINGQTVSSSPISVFVEGPISDSIPKLTRK